MSHVEEEEEPSPASDIGAVETRGSGARHALGLGQVPLCEGPQRAGAAHPNRVVLEASRAFHLPREVGVDGRASL